LQRLAKLRYSYAIGLDALPGPARQQDLSVRSNSHGDLLCHMVIETSGRLTEHQKELLREFEEINKKDGDRHNPRARSFMEKVREFFKVD
jgi:DnaJ-class molecular chaperone